MNPGGIRAELLFAASGAEGDGTDRLGGAVDLDALEAYFVANPNGVAPGSATASPG
jgi:hypothetical protein